MRGEVFASAAKIRLALFPKNHPFYTDERGKNVMTDDFPF